MDRLTLSEHLFALSTAIRLLPGTARRLGERAVQGACDRVSRAVEIAGAKVRGCGCTSEDPECCQRARETNPLHGDWCLCRCHDREVTTRTLGAEVN